METNFDEIEEALMMNREIEFLYKNELYAFVYHQKGWCFVNKSKNLTPYYETNKELLQNVRIDDQTFKNLFDLGLIEIRQIL